MTIIIQNLCNFKISVLLILPSQPLLRARLLSYALYIYEILTVSVLAFVLGIYKFATTHIY